MVVVFVITGHATGDEQHGGTADGMGVVQRRFERFASLIAGCFIGRRETQLPMNAVDQTVDRGRRFRRLLRGVL